MTEPTTPTPQPAKWKEDLAAINEKFAALYIEVLQQIRTNSADHFKHSDSMLTWAIGLMGAGVFYANSLLGSAPAGLRFAALAPWVLGILASLAARVIGVRRLETEGLWHLREAITFKMQVMVPDKDNFLFVAMGILDSFVRHVKEARTMGLYWRWLRLWFSAHILAGTGILTVVAVAFLPHTGAVVVIGLLILAAAIIFVCAFGAVKKSFERTLDEGINSFRKRVMELGKKEEGKPEDKQTVNTTATT